MSFFSEACERNKLPILEVAETYFKQAGKVLEIGSGTGQHAAFFTQQLPGVHWTMTDCEPYLSALKQAFDEIDLPNLEGPLALDVSDPGWPIKSTQLVYSANTLHIMSWNCVESFFAGVGRVLANDGYLLVYGPFKYEGEYTSDSNADFDLWLKERDPLSGQRDFEAVDKLATKAGLSFIECHSMPANNQCLVWKKSEEIN